MIEPTFNVPATALQLVRDHGGPLAHAALDPANATFRAPGLEGLIGYRSIHGCAVALGDPVCPPAQVAPLADAFEAHCTVQGWSILYAAATDLLQGHARGRGYGSIEFADLFFADPGHDPEAGPAARHLRQHINRARRDGVAIREYRGETAADPALEARAEEACGEWLNARHGAQMYLAKPRLFTDRPGRRWFLAERGGRVVGLLSLLRVNFFGCRDLINLVFATPEAPRHTSDLLVTAALRTLREEGTRLLCLGIAPRAELGRIEGFGGGSGFLARRTYRLASTLLHPHGKAVFWEKFGVFRRESLYLLFKPPRVGLREVYAIFHAFHLSLA